LNWGHLSPASDNPAVLADISGTVIESNGVFFEGPGFFVRDRGGLAANVFGQTTTFGDFVTCQGLGAGIGVDCWGAAQPAVRYDSPTWGGFRFEASYGKNTLTAPNVAFDNIIVEEDGVDDVGRVITAESGFIGSTQDSEFADIALFYTADWNSIKLSAAYAYTWIETGAVTGDDVDLHQVGASIMHKPSGLGLYGMYQAEQADGQVLAGLTPLVIGDDGIDVDCNGQLSCNEANGLVFGEGFGAPFAVRDVPDTDAWYFKPFWRKAWSPIGATVIYGEWGQYNDMFAAGKNLCFGGFGLGSNIGDFCAANFFEAEGNNETYAQHGGVFVTSSEVERWGLGLVQEIDSAAMHLWIRWQHQTVDANLAAYGFADAEAAEDCFEGQANCQVERQNLKGNFDDLDIIQVGGVIFF
jgi:hypothetical protein